jgi:diguanylate cyclase (GGDEF)-like protein
MSERLTSAGAGRVKPRQDRDQGGTYEAYLAESNDDRSVKARRGLWLAVVVYLPFLVTDLLLIPDVSAITIPARILIVAAAVLAMELQVASKRPAIELEITCAVVVLMGYVVWLVPAMTTTHVEAFSHYAVFGAIFMMGVNLFFNFQFVLAVSASGAIFFCFLLSLEQFNFSQAYATAFSTFYLCCFVFTSYVNWKLNRERFQVFLNAREAERQQRQAVERGEALLRLSITDSLTDVGNRRAADVRLEEAWHSWREQGRPFSVLLVDVDHFKMYNDFYGHQEGDRCLKSVANAVALIAGPRGAFVARYGGEEFIVIAEHNEEAETASLGAAICKGIRSLQLPHAQRLDGLTHVTVSVGATFTRAPVTKLESLISEADRALYRAKSDGRNCARVFEPGERQELDAREHIAGILKVARQQDLISIVYQPIQNLSSGQVDAHEALMRLRLPDGSASPPNVFIPIAERNGAIIELGYWAIERVCRDLAASDLNGQVSINVSPTQLRIPDFSVQVKMILDEAGVFGTKIAFEITEAVNMEIQPSVLRNIEHLRQLGISIWLDDFGTGFAGLSWLRLTKFDMVKIDKSFLRDATQNQQARTLLEDIIGLIKNRGHRVLVEGVETQAQLDLLNAQRVDAAQGFHIGRPAPPPVRGIQQGLRASA